MEIKLVKNACKREIPYNLDFLGGDAIKEVLNFHKSFPMYEKTPLVELCGMAKELNVGKILVKDESYRFGLNAFKVLGGSYAMGNYIANALGGDMPPYNVMISDDTREKIGEVTFITATDGNHGRGVAWTANKLKQKSIVYMPKGSAAERLENIRAEGADASIQDLNYDACVRLASEMAERHGYVMVQDTAWEGYEEIPTDIIKGYTTIAAEAVVQADAPPTHIFLQAGVGSLAAAITGYYCSLYGKAKPTIVVIEPTKADCLFKTASANDDTLHFVTDDMDTIMAGLACGEPCSIGWEVLRDYADFFISCDDTLAAKGMRMLASPVKGDSPIISGESGAAPFGCIAEILQNDDYESMKADMGICENSSLLFISTEGDTDRENYKKIVWDGLYGSC